MSNAIGKNTEIENSANNPVMMINKISINDASFFIMSIIMTEYQIVHDNRSVINKIIIVV